MGNHTPIGSRGWLALLLAAALFLAGCGTAPTGQRPAEAGDGMDTGEQDLLAPSPELDGLSREAFPAALEELLARWAAVEPTGETANRRLDVTHLIDREELGRIRDATTTWGEWEDSGNQNLPPMQRMEVRALELYILPGELVVRDWQDLLARNPDARQLSPLEAVAALERYDTGGLAMAYREYEEDSLISFTMLTLELTRPWWELSGNDFPAEEPYEAGHLYLRAYLCDDGVDDQLLLDTFTLYYAMLRDAAEQGDPEEYEWDNPVQQSDEVLDILRRAEAVEHTDVWETRVLDITPLLGMEDYKRVRQFILDGGEYITHGSLYGMLPGAEFDYLTVWLMPTIPLIYDPDSQSEDLGLCIRDFWNHIVGYQYYDIRLTPPDDWEGEAEENHLYLVVRACNTGIPDQLVLDNLQIYLRVILSQLT